MKSKAGNFPLEYAGAPVNLRRRRLFSMLIRAGAPLPRVSRAIWLKKDTSPTGHLTDYLGNPYIPRARKYVAKIAAAGSWAAYEKAHTRDLVSVFEKVFPRPRLPHEIASLVVRFWAHTGHY